MSCYVIGVKLGFKKAAFLVGYCFSGLACATGMILCLLLTLLRIPNKLRERWTRRMIYHLCAGFVAYLRFFKVLDVDFGKLPELGMRQGVIIAANHPTYIDAVLIMSQLPDVFCLTKAAILRNPLVSAMARSAGYESNADPSRLVKNCSFRLRNGENLLVFPEGTRTTSPLVGSFKRGFALMAANASVPVVTVLVTSFNGSFLRKGQPFFDMPQSLPLRYRFSTSVEFLPHPDESTRDFGMRIENHFRAALSAPSNHVQTFSRQCLLQHTSSCALPYLQWETSLPKHPDHPGLLK